MWSKIYPALTIHPRQSRIQSLHCPPHTASYPPPTLSSNFIVHYSFIVQHSFPSSYYLPKQHQSHSSNPTPSTLSHGPPPSQSHISTSLYHHPHSRRSILTKQFLHKNNDGSSLYTTNNNTNFSGIPLRLSHN